MVYNMHIVPQNFIYVGEQGVYPVMSYLELADIDLTKPVSE